VCRVYQAYVALGGGGAGAMVRLRERTPDNTREGWRPPLSLLWKEGWVPDKIRSVHPPPFSVRGWGPESTPETHPHLSTAPRHNRLGTGPPMEDPTAMGHNLEICMATT